MCEGLDSWRKSENNIKCSTAKPFPMYNNVKMMDEFHDAVKCHGLMHTESIEQSKCFVQISTEDFNFKVCELMNHSWQRLSVQTSYIISTVSFTS